MKLKQIPLVLLFLLTGQNAVASPISNNELRAQREHIIHQYILDLGRADHKDITSLFAEGGTVVSTSRGKVNAEEFFASFLTEIETANTEFHQFYSGLEDPDRFAARFHFHFNLLDGEIGDGEYVDEFVFAEDSTKLTQVVMFENLKFNNDR